MIDPTDQHGRYSVVVVTAHPDDEAIWCGGLMLSHPNWHWTVLCLCRAEDPDRAPRFKRICQHLGLKGWISDLDDSSPPATIDADRDIAGRILPYLHAKSWDLCITHGENGEYGHLRHQQVHQVVLELVRSGAIPCRELWTFAYDCDLTGQCRPQDRADILFPLEEKILVEKKRLIQDVYGFDPNSFEVAACISPESFHRTHISLQGEAL